MRIILFGASGMLGLHLYKSLVRSGHEVIPIVHTGSLMKRPWAEKILGRDNVLETDITSLEKLIETISAINDLDVLVNTVGRAGNGRMEMMINYYGVVNILRSLAKQTPETLVYVSSILSLGDTLKRSSGENEKCTPKTFFEKSKCYAEKEIIEYSEEHNMGYVILRPTWMLGEYTMGSDIKPILWMIKRGIGPVIGNRRSTLNIVYTGDAAEIIRILIERKLSGIYNIANPTPISTRNFVRILGETAGKRKLREVTIPRSLFNLASRINGVLRYLYLLPGEVSVEKTLTATGYNRFKDVRITLEKTYNWMQSRYSGGGVVETII